MRGQEWTRREWMSADLGVEERSAQVLSAAARVNALHSPATPATLSHGRPPPHLLRDIEAVQVGGPHAQPLDVGGGEVGAVVRHVHGALRGGG